MGPTAATPRAGRSPNAVPSAPPDSAPSAFTPWVTVESGVPNQHLAGDIGEYEGIRGDVEQHDRCTDHDLVRDAGLPAPSKRGPWAAGNAIMPRPNTAEPSTIVRPRPIDRPRYGARIAPPSEPSQPATVTPAIMTGEKSCSRVR